MKKVFGIQAEINITADEDIVKGIGAGIKNGTIETMDIIRELKPSIIKSLGDELVSRRGKQEVTDKK